MVGLSYRVGCCFERDLEEGKEEGKREKWGEGGRGGKGGKWGRGGGGVGGGGGIDKIFMYNFCNKFINVIDG